MAMMAMTHSSSVRDIPFLRLAIFSIANLDRNSSACEALIQCLTRPANNPHAVRLHPTDVPIGHGLPTPHSTTTLRRLMENVVVIGSGCAGWTAALYAARA